MQFWHRFSNVPISMWFNSGTMFGLTLLQLLGFQFLGLVLGLRFFSQNLRLKLAKASKRSLERRNQFSR